jgi:hypothetical protein
MRVTLGAALCLCLAGCSQPQTQKSPDVRARASSDETQQPAPAPRPPRSTVDPKSNLAAEELVRGLVRLLNNGRFDDAYMLLGPNAPPRPEFDRRFSGTKHLRVTEGSAGGQEGAAGSIYVSVPLTVSGEVNGKMVDRGATAILRRVNDVPGSTEAQRHWHIERIDWKDDQKALSAAAT